ncbi:protein LIFEGUARD 2 [Triticum aestivum]|uniref:protein LIFEGUARD 2 n=1 Tax=Triticum aestivum TaxID=4565 RepID=UPI001D00762A|nr:protein LIFEGUARD 2-like [Triticum aestivum]
MEMVTQRRWRRQSQTGRSPALNGHVHYTEDYLQKCINQDHDALPIKLADGEVNVVSRLITGNDRMTTITTNWTEFHCRTNMHEGDICAFYFRRKARFEHPSLFGPSSSPVPVPLFNTAKLLYAVLCPLYIYRQKHPVNLLLLGVFTVAISSAVGMTCAFTSGKVILEAAILTTVVVFSLTAYTFWAVKRGKDFSFLGPFLFASLIMLLVFGFIQILFPLGKLTHMIYGALAALIFSGYIVYDTDNIIKRYTYDEYVWAAVSLYLDIINLFMALLTLFSAGDS